MKYFLLLLILMGTAHAEKKKTSFWKKFLRRSFSGAIGHASIVGTDYRGYSHLRGRFDHTFFENTKIVAEGLFEYTDIRFKQMLRENPRNPEQAQERDFKYTKNNFRPEEFYISQEISDFMILSYGVQKVIWGQFEPYSPTNLVFPFNLSTTDVEFNKLKGTLPQEAGIISLYPTYNIILSLYVFPKLTYDNVLKNRFDNPGTYYGQNEEEQRRIVELPKGSDQLQTGARLMFYPSWGTFGLSYHKGYNTSTPSQNNVIESVSNSDNRYFVKEKIGLDKRETFGAELAIPLGSFIYKFELASTKTSENIRFDGSLNPVNLENPLIARYFNAIRDNDFKLSVPSRQNIMAVGTTGNLSRWYLNLVVFFITTKYKDKYQNLVDLNKQVEELSGNNDDEESRSWFPGGVISYYLNPDKTSEIGLAAGIISNGSGGAIFFKKTTDKFVYGATVQTIKYFSDDNITETSSDDYKRKNELSTGTLLSLTYKF